jgi:hypothetical protein
VIIKGNKYAGPPPPELHPKSLTEKEEEERCGEEEE